MHALNWVKLCNYFRGLVSSHYTSNLSVHKIIHILKDIIHGNVPELAITLYVIPLKHELNWILNNHKTLFTYLTLSCTVSAVTIHRHGFVWNCNISTESAMETLQSLPLSMHTFLLYGKFCFQSMCATFSFMCKWPNHVGVPSSFINICKLHLHTSCTYIWKIRWLFSLDIIRVTHWCSINKRSRNLRLMNSLWLNFGKLCEYIRTQEDMFLQ